MKITYNKINNLQVKPLNKKVVIPRVIPEPLPDPKHNEPFVMLLVAKIGSGKSTTLSNILRFYNGYFHRVYFCSSNIHIDEDTNEKIIKDLAYQNQFIFNQDRLFDNFNDNVMSEILDDIKECKKDPDYDEIDDHYLIIVDDLSQSFLNIKSLIVKTILKTRHIKLSWIITSQRFRNICPPIRNQCSYLLSFNCGNNKELDAISEMIDINFEDFKKLINETCSEQYKFLFIDSSKNPPKYYSGFDKEILFNSENKYESTRQPNKKKRRKKEYSNKEQQTEEETE